MCHTVDGEKKEAVMGETKLFEALNQVNQWFDVSKHLKQHMPATPAGENLVKASRAQNKRTQQMEMFLF